MNIAFVGLPGSGKSTVAKHLSKHLGFSLFDCDYEIELQAGCSISDYFKLHGELDFRAVESAMLDKLTSLNGVLSTGGGAVILDVNRSMLRQRCFVIYLHSSPDEVFRRIRHDRLRPLLQVDDPLDRLKNLYIDRDFLYRETANIVIESGKSSLSTLVNLIVSNL